jgi:O-antigen ligase
MSLPPAIDTKARRLLLDFTLLALGPLAAFAPKGIAVAMPAIALAAALAARPAPGTVARALLPALPLLAAALASGAWSIIPERSLSRALLLAMEFALAALLATALPARALRALAGAIAFAAATIVLELLSGGPLTQGLRGIAPLYVPAALSNGTTLSVLLLPPAAAMLWRTGHRKPALGLILLVTAAVFSGRQFAAGLGLVAAVLAAAAALGTRHAIRIGACLAAVLVLAMPLLLPIPIEAACRAATVKLSVMHRMLIWNQAELARQERPFTGWGLEATRAIPGGKNLADLWTPCGRPLPDPEYLPATELLPLHTHNAAIQAWLELGPAGAAALAGLVLALAWRARAADPAGRAAQAASFAAAVVIGLSSYGAWQGWWIATLALTVAAAGALNPITAASGRHPPPPSAP